MKIWIFFAVGLSHIYYRKQEILLARQVVHAFFGGVNFKKKMTCKQKASVDAVLPRFILSRNVKRNSCNVSIVLVRPCRP